MPRKSAPEETADDTPSILSEPTADPMIDIQKKLDRIVYCLDKMNQRDRMRTIGGTVRSFIALIPVVIVIWSAWYFSQHGTEFLKQISDNAVRSAAEYNLQQAKQLLEQMRK